MDAQIGSLDDAQRESKGLIQFLSSEEEPFSLLRTPAIFYTEATLVSRLRLVAQTKVGTSDTHLASNLSTARTRTYLWRWYLNLGQVRTYVRTIIGQTRSRHCLWKSPQKRLSYVHTKKYIKLSEGYSGFAPIFRTRALTNGQIYEYCTCTSTQWKPRTR